MLLDRKLCLILAELFIAIVCRVDADYFDSAAIWADKEYVDPHSFYYDKITNKESAPHVDSDDRRTAEYRGSNVLPCMDELNKCRASKVLLDTGIPDDMLSRRFVNMLLDRAIFKQEGAIFIGRIDLEASASDLDALREFGAGRLSLREVDPILNGVLKAPNFNRIYESVVWMQSFTTEFTSYMCYHKEIVIGVLTVLYLYWQLRKVQWSFLKILSMSIPLILIASFFITWWKLIEEERIKQVVLEVKHGMEMPVQCQPDKMGWADRIRAYFYADDCEKYYEAVMKKPELQVTPGQALTHMLANMSFEVFIVSGKAVAGFLKDVTVNLPWYISWPIQITVCISIVPAIIFSAILLLGGSLNLGFGPFSFFSLRGPRHTEVSHASKVERRTIENIPNVTVNVHIQDSGNGVTRLDRSHNLAITANSSAERSDQTNNLPAVEDSDPSGSNQSGDKHEQNEQDNSDNKKRSPVKTITNSDLASGDSTLISKSDSTENTLDTKVNDTVRESIKLQSGSGDN